MPNPERPEEATALPPGQAAPPAGTGAPSAVSQPAEGARSLTEAELLERHSGLVYNLALRLVGTPQDAEDLAQDSLLRALKALPRFRGECQVSTWLYRITVNTWKNRVRSEKRRGFWRTVSLGFFSEDEDEPAEAERLAADEPPLDAELERGDKAAAVTRALRELEAESRAVVVLRDIEGQSYEEIAVSLGIPEGTVKSRLSRAREALKGRLKRLL
ncbi:MAG: sigma-70 family RNA polymerase sigma factor [Elusimicrobia bacterium]|nr:sigma-70 family RNA polymerase sigma factor [Elusimicrobiota bacterium]